MASDTSISPGNFHSDELKQYIHQSSVSALDALSKDDLSTAFSILSQAEKVLETLTSQGLEIDPDMVLCVLHNLASCTQR